MVADVKEEAASSDAVRDPAAKVGFSPSGARTGKAYVVPLNKIPSMVTIASMIEGLIKVNRKGSADFGREEDTVGAHCCCSSRAPRNEVVVVRI